MNPYFGFLIFDFGFAGTAQLPRRVKIKNQKPKIKNRRGLTLLEVVIALAIFLFSLTAITQLLSFSRDRVVDGYLRSQANLRAQSKLAEVLTGAEPLSGSGWASFSDNPDWSWQVTSSESDISNLHTVQVGVRKKKGTGYLEVSVSQMVFSPAQRGSTLVYLANITDGPNPSTQQASSSGGSGAMAGGGAATGNKGGAATPAAKGGTATRGGGATGRGGAAPGRGAGGGTGRGGGGTGRGGPGGGTGRGGAGGGGAGGGGMGGGAAGGGKGG